MSVLTVTLGSRGALVARRCAALAQRCRAGMIVGSASIASAWWWLLVRLGIRLRWEDRTEGRFVSDWYRMCGSDVIRRRR